MDLRTLKLISGAIVASLFPAKLALAQRVTDADSNIAAGKVITPWGPIDKACVFEVPQGARVELNGDITRNGVRVDHHDPCSPEQMRASSVGDKVAPAIDHAWVAYSNADAESIDGVSFFNSIATQWTVPSNPTTYCGVYLKSGLCVSHPILYFFPSFESSTEIIQPVMSWGYNGNYGGANWSLSSWYWSPSASYYSPPISANPGDTIQGSIANYDPTHYQIVTNNATQGGHYTYLDINTLNPMNTVQSGVLEIYSLVNCNQLPPSNGITFSLLNSIDQAGPEWNDYNAVNPIFSRFVDTSDSPVCSWSVSVAGVNTGLGWSTH